MMKTGEMANDVGTIVSGDDAVKFGLIDEKGGLDSALACLRSLCKKSNKNAKNLK